MQNKETKQKILINQHKNQDKIIEQSRKYNKMTSHFKKISSINICFV